MTAHSLRPGSRTPRDLLVVGAGGFARETIEAVHAINEQAPTWRLLGLLDDDPSRHGLRFAGVPVIGIPELVHDHPDAAVVICTGRPDDYASRYRLASRLALPVERYGTIVHPAASLAGSCVVGAGSVLLAHVTATSEVVIGRQVCVMPQVVLTHDDLVGDWVTLASGVRVGGAARIGSGAYLGSGALIREGLQIGAWSMIGMGSVVTRDVPDRRVWFGAPARDVRAAVVHLGVVDVLAERVIR